MESLIAKYIHGFMLENGIKPTKEVAEKAGVGLSWLQSLKKKKGRSNPNAAIIERLHDYLVKEHGMESIINIPIDEHELESEAA